MPRTKLVNGVETPFTPAEEIARDAEEANWTAGDVLRAVKKAYKDSLEQAEESAPFDTEEKLVLLALYAEVKTFRAALAAGATAGSLDAPLIDAVITVFPGQTRAQIATTIENRVQSFLETAAIALATKIRDE